MSLWPNATLVFFFYVAAVAAIPGRRRPPRLGRLYVGVAAGLLFTAGVVAVPYQRILHEWIAPPIALLLAYWTGGLLFVQPNPAQERALLALDQRLGIPEIARRLPRSLTNLLEAAYVGVYPVIPLALVLYLAFVQYADPARFWSVILITDYICFGCLAWVQTRPPRSLERCEPWRSGLRRFNLGLVDVASIQVNTFPSGHAAEALVAVLLLLSAPWPVVLTMLLIALAISAGAVFGRYHYAADAFAGWVVAIGVWLAVK